MIQSDLKRVDRKPKFAILASPFAVTDVKYKTIYQAQLETPILMMYGMKDEFVPNERSTILSRYFKNCKMFEHNGGHYV